ncbi:hypothetical protein Cflav_PD5082 [Pedosphaera parvula Ellin514]|uniref:Uncharacterized protein n=1 Tax=Pedosphaera parvula (strain Ellin514) TaxID=320771 RepID=B9XBX9_PEDPL|nr:hypothetical protein Cflav_PD5082 [Pedosphaera parvula Ellin514]
MATKRHKGHENQKKEKQGCILFHGSLVHVVAGLVYVAVAFTFFGFW